MKTGTRASTALSIKNPRAKRLARAVARKTGETLTQAVIQALQERQERLRESKRKTTPDTRKVILEISRRCSALPDLDHRSPEQILGYDQSGLFH